MTTQALPLRQNRNIFRGILGHRPTRILNFVLFIASFVLVTLLEQQQQQQQNLTL
jgi:hypothetical protein